MKIKLSKTEAKEKVEEFFSDIRNKSPKEVLKIKKLSMNKKILLKEKRKLFCKKCLTPFAGKEKIRIKKDHKIVECKNCGYLNRIKIK